MWPWGACSCQVTVLRVLSVWSCKRGQWFEPPPPGMRERLLWAWKTKPSDKTFRSKTYLPKACNFHVQMPGSLNWRTKHARKMFTRCGLAPAGWVRDGFDLGKRRRSLERQNLQTKPSGVKLTCPKHVIFMSKCLEVLTGGRSMPGKCLRDVALRRLAGCEMGLTLESEEGEVPHLRWSQAPPLPWPRPGSADNILNFNNTIQYEHYIT